MLWQQALWHASGQLTQHPLRIHAIASHLWTDLCDEDWGYAYHLERWFHRFIFEHAPALRTENPAEADYVYVPHCAMNVYLAWKQQRFSQQARSSSSASSPHGEGDVLHGDLVRELDDTYFSGTVLEAVRNSAAASACVARGPTCRLLFVNMAFGRNELPRFSAAVGLDSVFVTTAGAHPRLPRFGAMRAPTSRMRGCSCVLHCQPLYSLGPLDIVVPFAVGSNSTSVSSHVPARRRDLLAVFIGSNTSCSRAEIFRRWGGEAAFQKHRLLISPLPLEEQAFASVVKRASFCLIPDGHWPATMRLPAVVMKDCIPVIISNRVELPFSDLIDWDQVSLNLSEQQIRHLPTVLQEAGRRDHDMRQHLRQLAEALDYHHPRFHLLLLTSLAARRPGKV